MSAVVPVLRAIVREELGGRRGVDLGVVTQIFTNAGGSGDHNLAVNCRLRGSSVELQQVPVMVGRLGLSHAPREGDLAVLGFVGGDLNAAVVLGFLYDEQVAAPDAGPTELVYVVPDDEEEAARRLHIQLPNGNSVTVKDKTVAITMGSTSLTIEADGAITLAAGGDIQLKSNGAVKIEAASGATLKGATVSVEGQSAATLKGAAITIAGNTNFSPA